MEYQKYILEVKVVKGIPPKILAAFVFFYSIQASSAALKNISRYLLPIMKMLILSHTQTDTLAHYETSLPILKTFN